MERRKCDGRNDFKKDRRGINYHIKGTASGSIDNIETVIWWIEVVLAVACLSCKGITVISRDKSTQLIQRRREYGRFIVKNL